MQKTKRIYISYAKIKTICIPSAKIKKKLALPMQKTKNNLHCPCKNDKKTANCKFFLFFAFLM